MVNSELLQLFCTEKPNHVFNPCGHAIDRQAALLWSSVPHPAVDEPIHTKPTLFLCPFCRTPLSKEKPFSKLIYQTQTDS
jgi:hypothetical protein